MDGMKNDDDNSAPKSPQEENVEVKSAAAESDAPSNMPPDATPPSAEQPHTTAPSLQQPNNKKSSSATMPVLAAVLTVALLVVIGVAAVKLNEKSQDDVNDTTQQPVTEPADQSDVDQQINEVSDVEQDIEEMEQDLETNDVTDENVGL